MRTRFPSRAGLFLIVGSGAWLGATDFTAAPAPVTTTAAAPAPAPGPANGAAPAAGPGPALPPADAPTAPTFTLAFSDGTILDPVTSVQVREVPARGEAGAESRDELTILVTGDASGQVASLRAAQASGGVSATLSFTLPGGTAVATKANAANAGAAANAGGANAGTEVLTVSGITRITLETPEADDPDGAAAGGQEVIRIAFRRLDIASGDGTGAVAKVPPAALAAPAGAAGTPPGYTVELTGAGHDWTYNDVDAVQGPRVRRLLAAAQGPQPRAERMPGRAAFSFTRAWDGEGDLLAVVRDGTGGQPMDALVWLNGPDGADPTAFQPALDLQHLRFAGWTLMAVDGVSCSETVAMDFTHRRVVDRRGRR